MNLFTNPDGANYQARAVLAFLSANEGIEGTWDKESSRYKAEPKVARWENCREQGYVAYMKSESRSRQINIAFFEHRNSDSICAVQWEERTINSPTLQNLLSQKDIYKNKWDVSHTVGYGKVEEMAGWITEQLEAFWLDTKNP